jgi:hypothetical protein
MPQANATGQKPTVENPIVVSYVWLEANGVFHNRMDCQRKRAAGFLAPLQLSPNRIGWLLHEVQAWLEGRPRRPSNAAKTGEEG